MHASSEIQAAIQDLAGFPLMMTSPQPLRDARQIRASRPPETDWTGLAKKPAVPQWLEGYKLCEQLLNLTTSSAQILDKKLAPTPSPIITSQAIMVGKALILAETLMLLPTPSDFDAQRDVERFSWLFPCSSRDRPGLEIYGGCGFSTGLLHRTSQITYCASRLHQYADSAVVPVTAQFLYDDLANMRQRSGESMDWETAQMIHLFIHSFLGPQSLHHTSHIEPMQQGNH
ncbi:hypothetical protein E4U43_006326 [Claviceps pusilla]|uniref:Uncharacterized protein n=1 Tax=Claviceps pusilla TaxID=123648 RepID=A0A9P7N2H7_9HYPO|nr:hypothetical protein E4U43_006326 [Claviceps pusilla]